jgi:hypothetical protein
MSIARIDKGEGDGEDFEEVRKTAVRHSPLAFANGEWLTANSVSFTASNNIQSYVRRHEL